MDLYTKSQFRDMHVGVSGLSERLFQEVPMLEAASVFVFHSCKEAKGLFDSEGWSGWPEAADEEKIQAWFHNIILKLQEIANDYFPTSPFPRRQLLTGTEDDREYLDVGRSSLFQRSTSRSECRFVAGEVQSSCKTDQPAISWHNLAMYARKLLYGHIPRRFVPGFSLCGPRFRIWNFDRLGGVASDPIDINTQEGGLQFVTAMLGFFWASEDQLGLDPTILDLVEDKKHCPSPAIEVVPGELWMTKKKSSDIVLKKYINFMRDGNAETLSIEGLHPGSYKTVSNTTCWRAYSETCPSRQLVIKDLWESPDGDGQGVLLKEAAGKHVFNVARYLHHETVRVGGADDDVWGNIRNGLDVTEATKYRIVDLTVYHRKEYQPDIWEKCSSSTGAKRPVSQTEASAVLLPPTKRARLSRAQEGEPEEASAHVGEPKPKNLVHRRIILSDFGRRIYEASSHVELLEGLRGCVRGHMSLYDAGILHRDVCVDNLMIGAKSQMGSPSFPGFLVGLGSARRLYQLGETEDKAGTRPFMAIGLLKGEKHSFMHDLESFFWVLFWICIQYLGLNGRRIVCLFDKWNWIEHDQLALEKQGMICHEKDFLQVLEESCTKYYRPLIPCIMGLRDLIFPNGRRWEVEDKEQYGRVMTFLEATRGQFNPQ